MNMQVLDLGTTSWSDAWAVQLQAHAEVLRGGPERIYLVEHPHVITLGRQTDLSLRNLKFPPDELRANGIEVVETDRGGNVTYHGPGQLVAYPIIKLSAHGLTVGGYVRSLQEAVIDCLARVGVSGKVDPTAVGVWAKDEAAGGADGLAKVCAIGVRVKRGVTLHGLALNVTTNLRYFDMIVPCGLQGRPVTSIRRVAGAYASPQIEHVRWLLGNALVKYLDRNQVIEVD